MLYQQGDVLIESVNNIPGTAKEIKVNGKIILAYGEATGHSHRIEKPVGITVYEDNGITYLEITENNMVIHEEHNLRNTVRQMGDWKFMKQEDLDYLKKIGIDISLPFENAISTIPTETVIFPGIYKVKIVREYDHFAEEAREVRD